MDLLRLLLILAVIVASLRFKAPVGPVLFGAGLLTSILFGGSLELLAGEYWELLRSARFIELTLVIMLITALGALLKELQFLDRLTRACRDLAGGRRTAAGFLPALVGLMPMPGGSLLSAPLVEEVMDDPACTADYKLVTNYWHRHAVEFFWPLYPGIIFTQAITGMPLIDVAFLQLPLGVAMIVIGIFAFLRRIPNPPAGRSHTFRAIGQIVVTVWPILLAIALFGLARVNLPLSVALAIVALLAATRPHWRRIVEPIRKGFSLRLVLMVFGILSFQAALDATGAIASIPGLADRYSLPTPVVIFAVCFLAGLLTGMVAAFVALGYVLLAGFLYQPVLVPANIMLAFLAGYLGMMFSPTHVCLIVTSEYFRVDLLPVYRRMFLPGLVLLAFGVLLYVSPWPALFGPK